MPSLDAIFDLTEGLDKEGFDYVVIALRKTDKKSKADIYIKLEDKVAAKLMAKSLEAVRATVTKLENE